MMRFWQVCSVGSLSEILENSYALRHERANDSRTSSSITFLPFIRRILRSLYIPELKTRGYKVYWVPSSISACRTYKKKWLFPRCQLITSWKDQAIKPKLNMCHSKGTGPWNIYSVGQAVQTKSNMCHPGATRLWWWPCPRENHRCRGIATRKQSVIRNDEIMSNEQKPSPDTPRDWFNHTTICSGKKEQYHEIKFRCELWMKIQFTTQMIELKLPNNKNKQINISKWYSERFRYIVKMTGGNAIFKCIWQLFCSQFEQTQFERLSQNFQMTYLWGCKHHFPTRPLHKRRIANTADILVPWISRNPVISSSREFPVIL
jgi:hypothetical protein